MGTRGIYGFRKNGVDKITYNHFDSYPAGLGYGILVFCAENSIEQLNKIYDKIIMIDEDDIPTEEQIKECRKWKNLAVSNQSENDWYCLLRNAQGNLNAYNEGLTYMIDSYNFIKDSLFCEYGYIINLDNNILEFWRGFQHQEQINNRYGNSSDRGYYPCALYKTFELKNICKKINKTEIKDIINNLELIEEPDIF